MVPIEGNQAVVDLTTPHNVPVDVPVTGVFDLRERHNTYQLDQFFKRPRWIVNDSTASAGFTVNLFSSWRVIPDVAAVLSNYALFRGTPRVRVQVTGSAQIIGKLRIYLCPEPTYSPYNPAVRSYSYPHTDAYFCTTSQMPHMDIDLSMASSQEIHLPFSPNRQFLKIGTDNDWIIKCYMLNPPKSITGATVSPLTIDVFVWYEDVLLDRIIPQAKEGPSHIVSKTIEYGAALAGRLPYSWANPAQKFLEFGASVARFLGYSRAYAEAHEAMTMRRFDNSAVGSGVPDMSFSLAIDPAVSKNMSKKPIPLSSEEDTHISFLTTKSSMVAVDWQHTTPLLVIPGALVGGPVAGHYQTTALGFASSMFQYWSGSIKVCMDIVASPLVRWRIGVIVVPPDVAVPAFFPVSGFISHVIEVNGSTCFDFEVPYLYQDPFVPVEALNFLFPATGQTRIVYYSLTVPTGPSPTPVYPYVNVTMCGGETFTLGVPTLELINTFRYEQQAGVGKYSEGHFGEIIDDVTLLAKRPTAWLIGTPHNELFELETCIPVQPWGRATLTFTGSFVGTAWWSYPSWLETAYFGSTGSYVHRFGFRDRLTVNAMVGNVAADVPFTSPVDNFSGRGSILFNPIEDNFVNVRVPDRNNKLFRYGGSASQTTFPCECVAISALAASQGSMVPVIAFYVSAGDDYTIGGFMAGPIISIP